MRVATRVVGNVCTIAICNSRSGSKRDNRADGHCTKSLHERVCSVYISRRRLTISFQLGDHEPEESEDAVRLLYGLILAGDGDRIDAVLRLEQSAFENSTPQGADLQQDQLTRSEISCLDNLICYSSRSSHEMIPR